MYSNRYRYCPNILRKVAHSIDVISPPQKKNTHLAALQSELAKHFNDQMRKTNTNRNAP